MNESEILTTILASISLLIALGEFLRNGRNARHALLREELAQKDREMRDALAEKDRQIDRLDRTVERLQARIDDLEDQLRSRRG